MRTNYTQEPVLMLWPRQAGSSLIELLIVLSITAILLGLSLIDLSSSYRSETERTQLQKLQTLITLTRQHAIEQQTTAVLCPADTSKKHCQNNWQAPLMLFLDHNQNNRRDNDEPLITWLTELPAQLSWNRGRSIVFYGAMRLAAKNGRLLICASNSTQGMSLVINRQGRVRVEGRRC